MAEYSSMMLVDPKEINGVKVNGEKSRELSKKRSQERQTTLKTTSNTLNTNEQMANGIGALLYGGIDNKQNVGSFMGMYDKYYKAATGRSRYSDTSGLNPRMFNQLLIMDRNTLQQLQPFIPGRFIFVPGEMPRCMEILHPQETEYIRTLFMTSVTSVTGFVSRKLETGTVQAMTEQNTYEVINKQVGTTRTLTFTFMTLLQGLPLYKYLTTWMQYIYNAGSSAATYPLFTGLEYHEGNHSMSGVYIIPDPSFQSVEDAALIYAMVPTENDSEKILNQTWGNHEISSYEITFKVHTLPGGMPQVLRIAQGVLADYVAEVELHDYFVNPASNTSSQNDPSNNIMGMGPNLLGNVGKNAMQKAADAEKANF